MADIFDDFNDDSFVDEAPKAKAKKALKDKSNAPEPSALEAIKVAKKPSSSASAAAPAAGGAGRTVEQIYQKKTQLEHILLRPDMYIGSLEPTSVETWVYDGAEAGMAYRSVTFNPGLYKIFDEILVNAADNKRRCSSMTTIKINIDAENNSIAVWNDGTGIPVQVHAGEGIYVPELIFGHLLTSSNYDDSEKKTTGGRNGLGAKLTNIYSTEFVVETADSKTMKKFKQTFRTNMSERSEPKIDALKKEEDWTRITFKPDLARFGMTGFDRDILALFHKRAYDIAGVGSVKVFLNDTRLPVKNFGDYVDLFIKGPQQVKLTTKVGDRWEVAFSVSDGSFHQVSFVNSIATYKGGSHVNYITDQIVKAISEAGAKKNKGGAPLKPSLVKNYISVFINCLIDNPSFDSQTKENMTTKATQFGSKCALPANFLTSIVKCGVMDTILEFAKFKSTNELKKTDGKARTGRLTGVAKLEDANEAGTKNSRYCTLILTEGDSAKSLAMAGLSVVGRDRFGVFPLRGKLLNVREATFKQLQENKEINTLKQILGLKQNTNYTDVSQLRYGSIMIMTDQDQDGSHIKGLIINWLHHFWPSLLKIQGFLREFITPIVKATPKRGEPLSFFTLPEFYAWRDETEDADSHKVKYYKGLGTSTPDEAKEYFSQLEVHIKEFLWEGDADGHLIELAFAKKKVDDRKDWLSNFKPGTFIDHSVEKITYNNFINQELILFSMADNVRSIPSLVDGFKPGQRKILFSCFKRNLVGDIKVAQLQGYVSEHSAYHHGEASLGGTIVGLAQNFVGANNINLLLPIGQFGTRHQGGGDAASARYIFTALNPITRYLFRKEDDPILSYLNDDGTSVEPEWYMPILPMVLVNGAKGIGTGWSTNVPMFNPRDIAANIKRIMKSEPLQEMPPYYKNFHGETVRVEKKKNKAGLSSSWETRGNMAILDSQTIEITELPIGKWTEDFKEDLEKMMETVVVEDEDGKKTQHPPFVKSFTEYHTDTDVNFRVVVCDSSQLSALAAEPGALHKKFGLTNTSSTATTNMMLFDAKGRIHKYSSAEEILDNFYPLRLEYYRRRKEHVTEVLNEELTRISNKVRFITEVIDGSLVVSNKKKATLLSELAAKKYTPFPKKASEQSEEADEEERSQASSAYDYLLSLPLWSLTAERVEALKRQRDEKEQQLKLHLATTPEAMWNTDLDEFLAALDQTEEAERAGASAIKLKIGKKAKTKGKRKADSDDDGSDYNEGAKKKAKKAAPVVAKPKDNGNKIAVQSKPAFVPTAPVLIESKALAGVKRKKEGKEDADEVEEVALPIASKSAAAAVDSDEEPTMTFAERIAMKNKENVPAAAAPKPAAKPAAKKAAAPPSPTTAQSPVPKRQKLAKRKVVSDSESASAGAPSDDVPAMVREPRRAAAKKISYKNEDDENDDEEDGLSVSELEEDESDFEESDGGSDFDDEKPKKKAAAKPKAVKAAAAPKPAAKKAAKKANSDSEEVVSKPAPKKAAKKITSDSGDDYDDKPKAKAALKKATKIASDSGDDFEEKPAKAAPKKAAPKKAASDSGDDFEVKAKPAPKPKAPAAKKAAAKPRKKKSSDSGSGSGADEKSAPAAPVERVRRATKAIKYAETDEEVSELSEHDDDDGSDFA